MGHLLPSSITEDSYIMERNIKKKLSRFESITEIQFWLIAHKDSHPNGLPLTIIVIHTHEITIF